MPETQRQRSSRGWSHAIAWGERCLWIVGIAALGYAAFLQGEAAYSQADGNRILDGLLRPGSVRTTKANPRKKGAEGSLVGRIEIPRLGLSAVIFEGSSDATLARGVGHLSGSALPGNRGNVVLAGHRDSFFRPLHNIRPGDAIALTTPTGVLHYRVASMQVVGPRQTEVLASVPGTDLTLITCYPFRYMGSAPDRFIVRGHAVP